MGSLRRFVTDEDGQGLAEYGLIIGLISLVTIALLSSMGTSLSGMLEKISGHLSSVNYTVQAGSGS